MIILDLDNCIADDQWRIPHINPKLEDLSARYHDYHLLSAFDKACNRDLFEGNEHIIIFTARPEKYRASTCEWLKRNGVKFLLLMMRPNDNHDPSEDLKRKQLAWMTQLYGIDLYQIIAAYDDKEDVVAMYKSYGLPAHVRFIHNSYGGIAP